MLHANALAHTTTIRFRSQTAKFKRSQKGRKLEIVQTAVSRVGHRALSRFLVLCAVSLPYSVDLSNYRSSSWVWQRQ